MVDESFANTPTSLLLFESFEHNRLARHSSSLLSPFYHRGLCISTCSSQVLVQAFSWNHLLPNPCMAKAHLEAERVMFGALDDLFSKTGTRPQDVGILIINCSLFVPTPCLSSMVVRHYDMREDVKSFTLGGMGCSAGIISIDLTKHMLHRHPNTNVLVVSMENITLNWYWGNDISKLVLEWVGLQSCCLTRGP